MLVEFRALPLWLQFVELVGRRHRLLQLESILLAMQVPTCTYNNAPK